MLREVHNEGDRPRLGVREDEEPLSPSLSSPELERAALAPSCLCRGVKVEATRLQLCCAEVPDALWGGTVRASCPGSANMEEAISGSLSEES